MGERASEPSGQRTKPSRAEPMCECAQAENNNNSSSSGGGGAACEPPASLRRRAPRPLPASLAESESARGATKRAAAQASANKPDMRMGRGAQAASWCRRAQPTAPAGSWRRRLRPLSQQGRRLLND